MIKKGLFLIGIFLIFSVSAFAQNASISGVVTDVETRKPISDAAIFSKEINDILVATDSDGKFRFENLKKGEFTIVVFVDNFKSVSQVVFLSENENKEIQITLEKLNYDLNEIQIGAERSQNEDMRRLRNVEGVAIYAGKKSEVILLKNATANLATNNARQIFKGIAGLNIHENDGAGLQLSIGARGLDPNRTSNFNTRQNGYDISADALGYPESYYTPPAQALKRIEIVRGAASLQYGPQFGGLLNFIFKDGNPDKAIEFKTENTVGSFGLRNSFNSLGGSKNGWTYFTFFQRKQGDGWRANSTFFQNTAFAKIGKKFGEKLKITAEFTSMNYLAQQPGGLVDFEFLQDARQSKRTRNWFKVNWYLGALTLDYKFSDKTKLNSRFFALSAERQALGVLNQINRPDPLRERDLVRGNYNNFGNETRLIHRYKIGQQLTSFLAGIRYYKGFTQTEQGFADDTVDPTFNFLNPNDLEVAAYDFPSENFSFFFENLFNLTNRWTMTPGARFEYIKTAADGFFKERVISGNQVILEQTFEVEKSNPRSLVLLGLGSSYRISKKVETYANFSQNYRSINFSDLAIVNPNLIVDSLLTDESGFNIDLGIRGSVKDFLTFDANIFLLNYKNRIGTGETILEDPIFDRIAVPFRTNIGDARIVGFESYAAVELLRLFAPENKKFGLSIFTNFSLLTGEYLTGGNAIIGNRVELIPPFSLKTGVNFNWKKLRTAFQIAHVAEHFTDATNATFTTNATRGIVPSYTVADLSFSYLWKRFNFQTGINNLADARYFTRRAVSYPGPGIIPADGRNFYFTLGVRI